MRSVPLLFSTGGRCGGSAEDLPAGLLQLSVRARAQDRRLHLLCGRGHQPAGEGIRSQHALKGSQM